MSVPKQGFGEIWGKIVDCRSELAARRIEKQMVVGFENQFLLTANVITGVFRNWEVGDFGSRSIPAMNNGPRRISFSINVLLKISP